MVARRTRTKSASKHARSRAAGAKTGKKRTDKKRWSQKVTETSDALTLDRGVFRKRPHAIALSLKRSADRSRRRKSSPFRSAMSMLTFYVNRGGRNLSAAQKAKLNRAKVELRELYGKARCRRLESRALRGCCALRALPVRAMQIRARSASGGR